MGMTKLELATRDQLAKHLGEEGHGLYAEYLMLFDVHFMSDKEAANGHIAYMIPNKGMIFINRDVEDIDAMDFLLRHEMLHEYLKHGSRFKKYLQKKFNVKDEEEPQFASDLQRNVYHYMSNMAADWEISKYYSPNKDFKIAKNIPYKDEFKEGLVLELDRPEWLDLSYEELLEELAKETDKIEKEMQKDSDFMQKLRRSVPQQAQDMEEQASEMEKEASEMEQELDKSMDTREKTKEKEKLKKKIEDLKKKAKQLKKQAEELKKDSEQRSAAFNEPDAMDKERKDKLDKIKDFWDKLENTEQLIKEIQDKIYDDRRTIAQKEKKRSDLNYIKKLSNDNISLEPMRNFVLSLNQTVRKQLAQNDREVDTYTRKSISNAAIKNVYRPGQIPIQPKKKKPVIQVIYDRSGSWRPKEKTRAGDLALLTLDKKYVKTGKIKLEVFYCSEGPVTADRAEADRRGGGMNGPAVISHINKTKPDNVIILTDSDPDYYDYHEVANIPGAAWFLFYDSTAPIFAGHIKARSKRYYDLKDQNGLQEITKQYVD